MKTQLLHIARQLHIEPLPTAQQGGAASSGGHDVPKEGLLHASLRGDMAHRAPAYAYPPSVLK